MLGLQYFAEIFSGPLVYTAVYFITGNTTDYLRETRDTINGMNVTIWGAPFTFLLLYLTFGSDMFLFKLVDEVSVFMI